MQRNVCISADPLRLRGERVREGTRNLRVGFGCVVARGAAPETGALGGKSLERSGVCNFWTICRGTVRMLHSCFLRVRVFVRVRFL